jgi:hypothetical protein
MIQRLSRLSAITGTTSQPDGAEKILKYSRVLQSQLQIYAFSISELMISIDYERLLTWDKNYRQDTIFYTRISPLYHATCPKANQTRLTKFWGLRNLYSMHSGIIVLMKSFSTSCHRRRMCIIYTIRSCPCFLNVRLLFAVSGCIVGSVELHSSEVSSKIGFNWTSKNKVDFNSPVPPASYLSQGIYVQTSWKGPRFVPQRARFWVASKCSFVIVKV